MADTGGICLSIKQELFNNNLEYLSTIENSEHIHDDTLYITENLDLFETKSDLIKTVHDKIYLMILYSFTINNFQFIDNSVRHLRPNPNKNTDRHKKLLEQYDIEPNIKETIYNNNKILSNFLKDNFMFNNMIYDISYLLQKHFGLKLHISDNIKQNCLHLLAAIDSSLLNVMNVIHYFIITRYDDYYLGLADFLFNPNIRILLDIQANTLEYEDDSIFAAIYKIYIDNNLDHICHLRNTLYLKLKYLTKLLTHPEYKDKIENNYNIFNEITNNIPIQQKNFLDGFLIWSQYIERNKPICQ